LLPEWSLGEVARQAYLEFKDHLWLYWTMGIAALACLVVQVALPLVFPDLARRARFCNSRTVFVLLTVATVVLLRWPGLAPDDLDPDESENIALALTLREDPRYWVSAEGGTHGPLVEFALLPVQLLGVRLDFGSARLVGLGLILGCLFFLLGTVRAFFPETISGAAVLPAILCVAFLTRKGYIVYNSEHPVIFLLCAGGYGCARLAAGPERGTRWRALVTGLMLGLVPFAKLQAVPIGLALAAVATVYLLVRNRGQRRQQRAAVLALGIGGLVPAAVAAVYLAALGLLDHFWASYVGSNFSYAQKPLGIFAKFDYFLSWAPEYLPELFMPYFAVAAGVGLVLLLVLMRRGWRCWPLLAAGVAVLLASVYSVTVSGFPFDDYLLFLLFPVAFLAAVVLATLYEAWPGPVGRRVLVTAGLGAAVAVALVRAHDHGNPRLEDDLTQTNPVAGTIRGYAARGEKLVVWGWMDGYYVLTGMRPATRESTYRTVQWKVTGTPRGDYFYRLFLEEFDREKPPVVVDAIGPWATQFVRPADRWRLDNFTDLAKRIESRYVLVNELEWGVKARVYVARERLAAMSEERLTAIPNAWKGPVPVKLHAKNRVQWDGGTARGDGAGSSLEFALPKPLWVKAVRVTCAYKASASPASFRMFWKWGNQKDFDPRQSVTVPVDTGAGTQTLTLPVNDTIDRIRIHPDTKCFECILKPPEVQTPEVLQSGDEEEALLVRQVREAVNRRVPPDATVAVVSYGGEALLQLGGQRRGLHFPQKKDGSYRKDFTEHAWSRAIAWLKQVRAQGAQFLLIPQNGAWLLDDKEAPGFKAYLENHARLILDKPNVCLIYDLRKP
jgi:hypothetical protein